MHLSIRPYLIIIGSIILLLLATGLFRYIVFGKDLPAFDRKYDSLMKGIVFFLFLVICASVVLIFFKGFLYSQLKAGNTNWSLVQLISRSPMTGEYGIGLIIVAGMLIALPAMLVYWKMGFESYDHSWGFVNTSGKEVISPKYSGTKLFHNGLARMQKGSFFKGAKTVYIDPTGKIVWSEK